MSVTGLVPAAAGTEITVEVLDPVTLKSVLCDVVSSAANAQSSSSSRINAVIDRTCVNANSGNVRLCWSNSDCAVIDFEPGKSVDLGLLTTKVEQGVPDPGLGDVHDDGARGLVAKFRLFGYLAMAVGFGGVLLGGHSLVRRHRHLVGKR
jgi:hypothetical protein